VAERARGRGVGRALYERLLNEVADLGYVMAFAGITLPNPASVALHESLGFTSVGVFASAGFKLGAWHDVGWWQRQIRGPLDTPHPPMAWRGTHSGPVSLA
jgi:phosphinothricin acetyltransferase